jgi:hypothetical protein
VRRPANRLGVHDRLHVIVGISLAIEDRQRPAWWTTSLTATPITSDASSIASFGSRVSRDVSVTWSNGRRGFRKPSRNSITRCRVAISRTSNLVLGRSKSHFGRRSER